MFHSHTWDQVHVYYPTMTLQSLKTLHGHVLTEPKWVNNVDNSVKYVWEGIHSDVPVWILDMGGGLILVG